ncbi:hypothetical protein [Rhizobium leguminosarum]|uniref:Uncharacterized protein n=1 Tax=Rhizobium leguminosarum TaxID=384 RepID=A0A7K3VEW0_RHILE|nr:hypothetical protein [Rhizobium leguminosarum]NEK15700.1 hypothetical protein [Rhizobium leguminosarum]
MPKVISIREEITDRPSLDDRIADAFEHGLASGPLAELLGEVQKTSADAQATSKEAETRALDPKLRPADVAMARQQMDDSNFRSKRMDAAAEQLRNLLTSTKAAEEAEVRRQAHAAAIVERDQLVKDLQEYEVHAKAIVSLLNRLAINNQKLHMDEQAERIARGFEPAWNVRLDDRSPKLLEMTRLPVFRPDGTINGYAWPPRTNAGW